MEYLITYIIYLVSRWWLFLPLVALIYWLLRRFRVIAAMELTSLLSVFVILLIFSVFSRVIFAPVINYYGKLALGEVTSSRSTMFVDVAYNTMHSVSASFEDEEGQVRQLSYWDSVWRTYPVFRDYGVPTSVGAHFVLKYLPLKPSEFIFITELPEKDRSSFCASLQHQLKPLEVKEEQLRKRLSVARSGLFSDLSRDERMALSSKIQRGKNLSEAEQYYKELLSEVEHVARKNRFIKQTLEDDAFCER